MARAARRGSGAGRRYPRRLTGCGSQADLHGKNDGRLHHECRDKALFISLEFGLAAWWHDHKKVRPDSKLGWLRVWAHASRHVASQSFSSEADFPLTFANRALNGRG